MNTYHLWLKLSGTVFDTLKKTIDDFSKAYHAPVFDPHVTLLSALPGTEDEIFLRTRQLGKGLQPFNISLIEPAYGEEYFQCIFLTVQKTSALMEAHTLARKIFQKESLLFMPHVSLLYGHYALEQRIKIAATLPKSLCCTFTVDSVDLIRARSENPKDWASIQTVFFGQENSL